MQTNVNGVWKIEAGFQLGVFVFLLSSVILTWAGFHISFPLIDPTWSWRGWTQLPPAVFHFWLAKAGYKAASWSVEESLIRQSGTAVAFSIHVYAPVVISTFAGVLVGYHGAKPGDGLIHLRGTRYFYGRDAIKSGRKSSLAECADGESGIRIHPSIQLSRARELLGVLVLGSPGSGKTQVLWSALLQMIARPSAKIFLLDNKGDFTGQVDPSISIILAPWDSRSEALDIGATVKTELDAELFAASTVPVSKGENAVFSKAARLMLTGLIVCLQKTHGTKWGWTDLAQAIEAPANEIVEAFTRHFAIGLKIFRENSRTSESVVFDLIRELAFIRHLATAWPISVGKFNLNEWLKDDSNCKPVLLLQVNKAFASVSDPLCCAVLNLISRQVLSPQFPDNANRRLYFLLDEIAQIPYVEQLKNLTALGRSKGVSIWLGLQDIGLLIETYGRQEIDSLISMLRTKIILQIGAGPGADYASKLLGAREVERYDSSKNAEDAGKIATLSQVQPQQLVLSDQVSGLKLASLRRGIQGWLSIDGWGMTLQLRWPAKKIPLVRSGLILADWASPDCDQTQPSQANGTFRKIDAIVASRIPLAKKTAVKIKRKAEPK
ncbi:type IV secretion system DNA-binding domain-containing protein [Glaciimonas sp. PCH181]|uniref:type IV secretion system DNA-binding domain-containing protein n=1 Tax=Glaciimonas sp. PCH181 TaxID=2133943 RepID=UPI000D3928BC|nr:type IV secretion system DNA-binding domain-containing protein [Glaciimonas sp. PCH181]PUA17326.1 hypothetical protein C7W93_15485 [Glaciimonas sp. PCH181]